MLTLLMFLGLGHLFPSIGLFFNNLFGVNTDPPDPPAHLVSVTGSAFDLPNSNIIEPLPQLIKTQHPINPSSFSWIPLSTTNFYNNQLGIGNIYNQVELQYGNIPEIPNFKPLPSFYFPTK